MKLEDRTEKRENLFEEIQDSEAAIVNGGHHRRCGGYHRIRRHRVYHRPRRHYATVTVFYSY